jgi:hypothetical protein
MNLRYPLFFIIFHYSKKKMKNNDTLICWWRGGESPSQGPAPARGPVFILVNRMTRTEPPSAIKMFNVPSLLPQPALSPAALARPAHLASSYPSVTSRPGRGAHRRDARRISGVAALLWQSAGGPGQLCQRGGAAPHRACQCPAHSEAMQVSRPVPPPPRHGPASRWAEAPGRQAALLRCPAPQKRYAMPLICCWVGNLGYLKIALIANSYSELQKLEDWRGYLFSFSVYCLLTPPLSQFQKWTFILHITHHFHQPFFNRLLRHWIVDWWYHLRLMLRFWAWFHWQYDMLQYHE